MKRILAVPRTFAAAALVLAATGAQAQLSSAGTIAVPTYEAVGLYWTNPGGTAGCEVKFRKSGASAWRAGLAMWYDARDSQCRGSLVHLDPNSTYEVELNLPGQPATRALTFSTWSNSMPVAKTIAVNSGSATLNVAEGGSASGYVVYDGRGATLDAGNNAQYNVTINASYVIVRGLNLKGAKQDAIRISPNVTNVVIEDNDISGWGRTRDGKWGADMDSAVRAVCTSPTMQRVTIQRNRIHDPRYGANSWTDGHPAGPQGVTFSYCGGNHVIRHNDMYSSNGNYFNDVIGGEDNFTKSGFPNADTDIYGNRLGTSWDDGIEAEGANENVRIWGNYIDRTAIGIATTVTSVGPVYIFRNVWNRAQMYAGKVDTDDRQPFFKSGSDASLGNGRRYVFHNTMLQARDSGAANGLGGGFGMGGTGSTQLINNTFSKNNIYHLWKEGKGAVYQSGANNEFASDLYNGTSGDATVAGGISGTPVYTSGSGWQSEAGGQYQLASNSPGYGRGVRIANFNDTAAAPDVGAHQSGTGAMGFGVAASPGPAVGASSNTTPTPTPTPTPAPAPAPTPTPSSSGGVATSAASLAFGSVQGTQTVTYTNNTAASVTFVKAAMSSGRFGQSNNCADVAPGASCTATVTYYPSNTGTDNATFTMTSSAPNSPHVVNLSASSGTVSSGAKVVISHFYASVLGRAPDAGGSAFWEGEAQRMVSLGADINEAWFAMAMAFFSSAEYAARGRDDAGFVTDLYETFASRAPDASGFTYWRSQLASGMPREVMLSAFMFSGEFAAYTRALFGNTAARAEVNTVMDLYRGLLGRLPDSAGFNSAVQRLRSAQCKGAAAVNAEIAWTVASFTDSAEYSGRRRSTPQFVGDLYNATLRRGGDLGGVQFWINELGSGKPGAQVRGSFVASPEFSMRVQAIIGQGCLG